MAQIDFQLSLRGGEDEFDYKRYASGSSLQGTVIAIPDQDVNCRRFTVQLLWHTTGRGSRYTETVSELDLYQGTLQAGMPRSFDFDFVLPNQPWSFEGHYINIVWKVQVQVDVAWASDPKDEIAFVLRPSTPADSF